MTKAVFRRSLGDGGCICFDVIVDVVASAVAWSKERRGLGTLNSLANMRRPLASPLAFLVSELELIARKTRGSCFSTPP